MTRTQASASAKKGSRVRCDTHLAVKTCFYSKTIKQLSLRLMLRTNGYKNSSAKLTWYAGRDCDRPSNGSYVPTLYHIKGNLVLGESVSALNVSPSLLIQFLNFDLNVFKILK